MNTIQLFMCFHFADYVHEIMSDVVKGIIRNHHDLPVLPKPPPPLTVNVKKVNKQELIEQYENHKRYSTGKIESKI